MKGSWHFQFYQSDYVCVVVVAYSSRFQDNKYTYGGMEKEVRYLKCVVQGKRIFLSDISEAQAICLKCTGSYGRLSQSSIR